MRCFGPVTPGAVSLVVSGLLHHFLPLMRFPSLHLVAGAKVNMLRACVGFRQARARFPRHQTGQQCSAMGCRQSPEDTSGQIGEQQVPAQCI